MQMPIISFSIVNKSDESRRIKLLTDCAYPDVVIEKKLIGFFTEQKNQFNNLVITVDCSYMEICCATQMDRWEYQQIFRSLDCETICGDGEMIVKLPLKYQLQEQQHDSNIARNNVRFVIDKTSRIELNVPPNRRLAYDIYVGNIAQTSG